MRFMDWPGRKWHIVDTQGESGVAEGDLPVFRSDGGGLLLDVNCPHQNPQHAASWKNVSCSGSGDEKTDGESPTPFSIRSFTLLGKERLECTFAADVLAPKKFAIPGGGSWTAEEGGNGGNKHDPMHEPGTDPHPPHLGHA